MKLATLKTESRDGQLIVVNRSLTRAVKATKIALTMQQALDDWTGYQPQLQSLYQALNENTVKNSFDLDVKQLAAPLPRAYQWADGSAYVTHVELVRKARGADMPENFWTDPLMYQGGSDNFIGPCDPIEVSDEAWGIDFEAEVAVVTDDVPMAITAYNAANHIKLITLVNDVSLRNLIPNEIAKGFGFFHSKPATAFAPVFITPDECGAAWHDNKLHLPVISTLNKKCIGQPNAGVDMTFDFGTLISHAAKTRHLCAGTIIGSGTVSNSDRLHGSSCLAEKRMLEILATGQAKTPFMHFGDRIHIEVFTNEAQSLFGAIDQVVKEYKETH